MSGLLPGSYTVVFDRVRLDARRRGFVMDMTVLDSSITPRRQPPVLDSPAVRQRRLLMIIAALGRS